MDDIVQFLALLSPEVLLGIQRNSFDTPLLERFFSALDVIVQVHECFENVFSRFCEVLAAAV